MTDSDTDLEKAHIPEDLNGPIEHPGVATEKDGEPPSPTSRCSGDTIESIHSEQEPSGTRSRSSTVQSRSLSVIPRSKRRGLLGRFALIPEVEKPSEYKRSLKWFITFIVALAGAAAPMGSSIFYRKSVPLICSVNVLISKLAALPQISKELHTTSTITNLSVAMYMLSMSIFPLWWSSFSETLGRRTIYIASFILAVIFNVLAAVSTSIGMLIAMRILSGGAAAAVQAVGAGTIADVWEPKERGKAMGIFYLGPLMVGSVLRHL